MGKTQTDTLINTESISIKDAGRVVESQMKRPVEYASTVMFWGGFGIGKSKIIQTLAMENEWQMIDVRLSELQPEDLVGIPHIIEDALVKSTPPVLTGVPAISHSDVLDLKKPCIIFLDELNQAPQEVMKASFKLLNDRVIGDVKLPDNWRIVAAGNLVSSLVEELNPGIKNRMVHYHVEANVTEWLEYALGGGNLHPGVVGYIDFNNSALVDKEEHYEKPHIFGFCSPRSLEFASNALHTFDLSSKNVYDEKLLKLELSGAVGETAALGILNLMTHLRDLPNPAEVLAGTAKIPFLTYIENSKKGEGPSKHRILSVLIIRACLPLLSVKYKELNTVKEAVITEKHHQELKTLPKEARERLNEANQNFYNALNNFWLYFMPVIKKNGKAGKQTGEEIRDIWDGFASRATKGVRKGFGGDFNPLVDYRFPFLCVCGEDDKNAFNLVKDGLLSEEVYDEMAETYSKFQELSNILKEIDTEQAA